MVSGGPLFGRVLALWLLSCGGVLIAWSPCARAEEPSIAWSAPQACPRADEVRRRVATLLAASPPGQRLSAKARIVRRGGRYRLELVLKHGGRRSQRALSADDCDALADAAAFLIAVTSDPSLPTRAAETSHETAPSAEEPSEVTASEPEPVPQDAAAEEPKPPAPEPEPEPEATERNTARRAPEPATGALRRAQVRPTSYGAALTLGMFAAGLAGPSVELGLSLGTSFSRFYVELRGAHVFARSTSPSVASSEGQGVKATFSSQHIGLSGCYLWGTRVRGGPCAFISGVFTHGETRGVEQREEAMLFWLPAGLSGALRMGLPRHLELAFDGGVGVSLTARPRFVVENLGTLGEVPYLSGYFRAGVGVALP